MVFIKSLLDSVMLTFGLFFGSLMLFGFQEVPFVSAQLFSPLGFVILVLMFFLELIGIRW